MPARAQRWRPSRPRTFEAKAAHVTALGPLVSASLAGWSWASAWWACAAANSQPRVSERALPDTTPAGPFAVQGGLRRTQRALDAWAAWVIGHELGHFAGLGHSCEDGENCTDPAERGALMHWTHGACEVDAVTRPAAPSRYKASEAPAAAFSLQTAGLHMTTSNQPDLSVLGCAYSPAAPGWPSTGQVSAS